MFEVTMPRAGQTMEEGTIVAWLKSEGEAVEKGEILAEIETDKAVFEFESPESGTLLKILYEEDSIVPVLETIALLGNPDEDPDAYLVAKAQASKPTAAGKPDAAGEKPAAKEGVPADGGLVSGRLGKASRIVEPGVAERPKASPAARKAAREAGIDLGDVGPGSGPGGRILVGDLAEAQAARSTEQTGSSERLIRRAMTKRGKAIAANLQFSKQTIPHFYARVTIDAGPLVAFTAEQKTKFKCSINDVVTLACARAVAEFPVFRSRIEGNEIVEIPDANIGIAVGTDEGLVVPVVRGADSMTLESLAGETRRVVAAARSGKLEGVGQGVFTISNLGMFGVEEFSAIINPPESAILAIGAVREDVIVKNGAVSAGRVMTMTLSADHRLIDGVAAAKFLARTRQLLERPDLLG